MARSELAVPRSARTAMNAAQRAQLSGNIEEAREHLNRALEIFPNFPDALNNLGTMYYRMENFEKATELFRRAADADSDCYAAWVNLSGSLTSLGRFDEALKAAQEALRLRPGEALANAHAARVYFYKHDYERSRKYYEKVLAIDPGSSEFPQLFLAHIALGEHRMEEARAYYRDYLRLHPNAPDADTIRRTLKALETDGIAYGVTAFVNH